MDNTDRLLTFQEVAELIGRTMNDVAQLARLPPAQKHLTRPCHDNPFCNGNLMEMFIGGGAEKLTASVFVNSPWYLCQNPVNRPKRAPCWNLDIRGTSAPLGRDFPLLLLQSRFYLDEAAPHRVLYFAPQLEPQLRDYFDLRDPCDDGVHTRSWGQEPTPAIRLRDHDRYLAIATRVFQLQDNPPPEIVEAAKNWVWNFK